MKLLYRLLLVGVIATVPYIGAMNDEHNDQCLSDEQSIDYDNDSEDAEGPIVNVEKPEVNIDGELLIFEGGDDQTHSNKWAERLTAQIQYKNPSSFQELAIRVPLTDELDLFNHQINLESLRFDNIKSIDYQNANIKSLKLTELCDLFKNRELKIHNVQSIQNDIGRNDITLQPGTTIIFEQKEGGKAPENVEDAQRLFVRSNQKINTNNRKRWWDLYGWSTLALLGGFGVAAWLAHKSGMLHSAATNPEIAKVIAPAAVGTVAAGAAHFYKKRNTKYQHQELVKFTIIDQDISKIKPKSIEE